MGNGAKYNEVHLTNARIDDQLSMTACEFNALLDMNGIEITQHLFMHDLSAFREVNMMTAKIRGQIVMDGSTFEGTLNMNSVAVNQSLFMRDKAVFQEVDLTNAKVQDQVNMIGSSFNLKLTMNGIEVGRHLFMRGKSSFEMVDLGSAKIGGQLDLSGSMFTGQLSMNQLQVSNSLLMRDKSSFEEIDIINSWIGGQVDLSNSKFNGKVDMDGIDIAQSLFMRSAIFSEKHSVLLYFAKIGSSLDLSGATISVLDLTSTDIQNEIRLGSAKGHQPTNWIGKSRMVLRNTTVGAIQDAHVKMESWPESLELEGFEYNRLGGFGAEGTADILNRSSKWFISWLDRDKSFSPQPFELLANVLHESGYPSKANAVRYASRKRSCREAWHNRDGKSSEKLRWFGLKLLQLTIGYGLGSRYFRVLWWFGGFTLLGFVVLLGSIKLPNPDYYELAWASFDQILPIVTLNGAYEELILENCSKWGIVYFYFQKLIGYVLGGFLGAGLAGLTQKN